MMIFFMLEVLIWHSLD
ncbi:hypothetical protein ARAM_007702 [Aspergillus rambellii]|uniref:Uncharacterized protein n=1 Tax=Aspergillus rambellii TaxID=308745 RepID=A0A0F8X2T6_9EURO|nr:hypothetical protein ARAM_007702 [Aspergillus rambellii]